MQKQIQTIDILLRQFGGRLLIPFTHAAFAAGIAEQTARNQQSQGTFPIPTIERECAGNGAKTRKRRLVHIRDLAAYIDELSAPKRGPGRPTKAESLATKAAGPISPIERECTGTGAKTPNPPKRRPSRPTKTESVATKSARGPK